MFLLPTFSPASPYVSVLSECRHLPMLVVMILSVRLVTCQTHQIYSGLFLMLTLMFLFFTRIEENSSVLELLSTNTLYQLPSNQETVVDRSMKPLPCYDCIVVVFSFYICVSNTFNLMQLKLIFILYSLWTVNATSQKSPFSLLSGFHTFTLF